MAEQITGQTLVGTETDEHFQTGQQDDHIFANAGNDTVEAGAGNDYVLGGSGQDKLVGDTAEEQTFSPAKMAIVEDYDMSVTFDYESAGYKNTLGTYKIDPETGEISDVQILWANASLAGSGGDLVSGASKQTVSLSAGDQVGFFLVANGFNKNDFGSLPEGELKFVSVFDSSASVDGNAPLLLQHVSKEGQVTTLNGSIYHSSSRTFDHAINADGLQHALGATASDGALQIRFEDLFGGGDRDFEDAVFTLDVGATNLAAIHDAAGVESQEKGGADRLEGRTGEDEIIGHAGNDLLVGGGAGAEWELVDGKWVYKPDLLNADKSDPYVKLDGSADVITGGSGADVLIGNAGDDRLYAGSGDDRINAGLGDDAAYGGAGADVINLEDGDDFAEAGVGADTVNAGAGDDIVYGDMVSENVLRPGAEGSVNFGQYGETQGWQTSKNADTGLPDMSQTVETEAGETYTLSFDLASNLPAGVTHGTVEVLWNGEVLDTFDASSGVYQTHSLSVQGTGEPGVLSFRNIPSDGAAAADAGPIINTTDPIFNYQKTVNLGGEDVDVAAFAPGQSKLYQITTGQLKVFDTGTNQYVDAGPSTGVKVNAIGLNVEDDLIYGIAKTSGKDALGNPVLTKDLVMLDAHGQMYRVGKTPVSDYVGDFDAEGNLWTFDSSINRITKIDVDNLDADGNPAVENIYLPDNFFGGRAYDIAFNQKEQAFYVVEAPSKNGMPGAVHRIDVTTLDGGGVPVRETIPITETLFGSESAAGMPKGAYGAVFMDGDGNLYVGLNKGDHDLDSSTGVRGGIYKINYDFETGEAHAEFMANARTTAANDGAVDPRAIDPFAEVDTEATVLIRKPSLTLEKGGDDDLRGGAGNDEMYGNAGDDVLHGGTGEDTLSGGSGDDRAFGGAESDVLSGGAGKDFLSGDAGDDVLSGDAGDDYLSGGSGDDMLQGGAGADALHGEAGNDRLSGDAGNDALFAGSGDDWADGGANDDTINLGAGNDTGFGGAGKDFIQGKDGNDRIDGGAGADKLVGGSGSDTIEGGAGNDHMWGGQWWRDNASDVFKYQHGGGKDTIHDFEVDADQIDLTAYGLSYEDVQDRIIDRGWATEINLEGIDKSGAGDKILLKSINPDDLNETNFLL